MSNDESDKQIWEQLKKTYGKDKMDGDETFGPMRTPEFDFKKHYVSLMTSHKNALLRIDDLEHQLAERDEQIDTLKTLLITLGRLETLGYTTHFDERDG